MDCPRSSIGAEVQAQRLGLILLAYFHSENHFDQFLFNFVSDFLVSKLGPLRFLMEGYCPRLATFYTIYTLFFLLGTVYEEPRTRISFEIRWILLFNCFL